MKPVFRGYEQAAARFGTIDVSIQNAGVITIDYYDRMPKADFEKVLAVNTTGVWCAAARRPNIW